LRWQGPEWRTEVALFREFAEHVPGQLEDREGRVAVVRVPGETTVDEIDVPAARIKPTQRFPDEGKNPITPSKVDLLVSTVITKLQSVVLARVFKISLPADLQDFLSTLELTALSAAFPDISAVRL
jgi:hypothetical protein